ncbi:membrane protein [Vibrio diazotrophicus]|uniref:membrane protein n=1 Tax=Vibrio diazotrophicus TaxID=685 RepID=UPI0005A6EA5F|nr:membrane protein [Vibrio diazotrophicus]
MQGYIYLLATVAFTVYGQIIIKWRMNQVELPSYWFDKLKMLFTLVFDPFVLTGFLAAFLSALAWMAAMTKFEVSFAYPIVISGLVIFTTLLAIFFLGESFSVMKMLALSLIVFGVSLLILEAR